jgi:SNF2 family DNA or RNA helicase
MFNTVPLNQPLDVKFIVETKNGTFLKKPGQIVTTIANIEFIKSPFELKDELKSMKGARWHGFDDPPRKIWTASNCFRNWFQLRLLLGENVFEWFEQPVKQYEYQRPLMSHQRDMANTGLTYHYQIWAAEMGTGKTLSALEVMERSQKTDWWWIGPKSALYAIEREFKKWEISDDLNIEVMTYEGLVKRMSNWSDSHKAPMGVIFDESSRCKTPTAKRTQAAQALADGIRKDWGFEGYVIEMSGTPSPKSPADWWAQAEIAWPGYLREGSRDAFQFRLGVHRKEEGVGGTTFHKLVTWRDDTRKCAVCGELAEDGKHNHLLNATNAYLAADRDIHDFQESFNEVAYLNDRLNGLVIVKHKKDCLDLPDKRYQVIQCNVKPSTARVAQALLQSAPNTITGLTWLRELSDGFQYRNKVVGKTKCPVCEGSCSTTYWVDPEDTERMFTMIDMMDPVYVATLEKQDFPCASCGGEGEIDKFERTVKIVPTPKEEALIDLLGENEETGRLVVFAGFTGSIDRVVGICLKHDWDVVRVDGRGWQVHTKDGIKDVAPLDYWADVEQYPRVVFVAHPKSGGMGLTLTEARMAVYWSNDYNPESRSQSEDRIHRLGMDLNKGATIVDLIHLPTDLRVLEILKDNRRLELMSMGDFNQLLEEVCIDETGSELP